MGLNQMKVIIDSAPFCVYMALSLTTFFNTLINAHWSPNFVINGVLF